MLPIVLKFSSYSIYSLSKAFVMVCDVGQFLCFPIILIEVFLLLFLNCHNKYRLKKLFVLSQVRI